MKISICFVSKSITHGGICTNAIAPRPSAEPQAFSIVAVSDIIQSATVTSTQSGSATESGLSENPPAMDKQENGVQENYMSPRESKNQRTRMGVLSARELITLRESKKIIPIRTVHIPINLSVPLDSILVNFWKICLPGPSSFLDPVRRLCLELHAYSSGAQSPVHAESPQCD